MKTWQTLIIITLTLRWQTFLDSLSTTENPQTYSNNLLAKPKCLPWQIYKIIYCVKYCIKCSPNFLVWKFYEFSNQEIRWNYVILRSICTQIMTLSYIFMTSTYLWRYQISTMEFYCECSYIFNNIFNNKDFIINIWLGPKIRLWKGSNILYFLW